MPAIEESELADLKDRLFKWEGDALSLIEEIKTEVTNSRAAMDTDPPDLYTLSNSLVDLSILNTRLIERIINAKYLFNEAKGLYERSREGWKVKLVQGYTYYVDGEPVIVEGVGVGLADSMKVAKVQLEYEVMNQAEMNYDNVNLTRRAIEKAMESIRSKLSYEKAHET